jgi:glycosyltransferase involved in cell wall biosynthesis
VERIWQELAEEFAALGHEVVFFCRTHPSQQEDETLRNVRYVRRTRFVRSQNIYWDLCKDLLYSARMACALPTADVVVTNAFWLPALLPLMRPRSGKIVVNVARMPKGQISLYRHVDRLAAVSGAVRDAILEQHASAGPRVKVIPNPIDTSIFKPGARPAGGVPTILYAGRVHPEKGVHLLIEAFRLLCAGQPHARLRILGPSEVRLGGGGEVYWNRLRAAAGTLPVEFCEPVFDKTRLAQIYQSASIFCYPSLAESGESFGLAPLEAMATALPPVVSDLACFRDFIVNGVTGVVFQHRAADPAAALAEALRPLLDDPAVARRMGEAAARTALRFGRREIAAEYLADFHQLVGSPT